MSYSFEQNAELLGALFVTTTITQRWNKSKTTVNADPPLVLFMFLYKVCLQQFVGSLVVRFWLRFLFIFGHPVPVCMNMFVFL